MDDSEVKAALDLKALATDVYAKTALNPLLDAKADDTEIFALAQGKADTTDANRLVLIPRRTRQTCSPA